jgi:hypothetical protein
MSKDGKSTSVLGQITVAIVVALIAGGTSPWWVERFFPKSTPASESGKTPTPTLTPIPTPEKTPNQPSGTHKMRTASPQTQLRLEEGCIKDLHSRGYTFVSIDSADFTMYPDSSLSTFFVTFNITDKNGNSAKVDCSSIGVVPVLISEPKY